MPIVGTCGDCVSFRNDADHLEEAFAGLTIMGSGRGSVRSADGLCSRHGLYLGSDARCDDHASREPRRASSGIAKPRQNTAS